MPPENMHQQRRKSAVPSTVNTAKPLHAAANGVSQTTNGEAAQTSLAQELGIGETPRTFRVGRSFLPTADDGDDRVLHRSSLRLPSSTYHALRYDFKPASVAQVGDMKLILANEPENGRGDRAARIGVENAEGVPFVFRGHTKTDAKMHDCVLIIDEATGDIVLERLSSTILVKKTTGADAGPQRGNAAVTVSGGPSATTPVGVTVDGQKSLHQKQLTVKSNGGSASAKSSPVTNGSRLISASTNGVRPRASSKEEGQLSDTDTDTDAGKQRGRSPPAAHNNKDDGKTSAAARSRSRSTTTSRRGRSSRSTSSSSGSASDTSSSAASSPRASVVTSSVRAALDAKRKIEHARKSAKNSAATTSKKSTSKHGESRKKPHARDRPAENKHRSRHRRSPSRSRLDSPTGTSSSSSSSSSADDDSSSDRSADRRRHRRRSRSLGRSSSSSASSSTSSRKARDRRRRKEKKLADRSADVSSSRGRSDDAKKQSSKHRHHAPESQQQAVRVAPELLLDKSSKLSPKVAGDNNRDNGNKRSPNQFSPPPAVVACAAPLAVVASGIDDDDDMMMPQLSPAIRGDETELLRNLMSNDSTGKEIPPSGENNKNPLHRSLSRSSSALSSSSTDSSTSASSSSDDDDDDAMSDNDGKGTSTRTARGMQANEKQSSTTNEAVRMKSVSPPPCLDMGAVKSLPQPPPAAVAVGNHAELLKDLELSDDDDDLAF